jgi:tetratricopeptide (TPR) repeat protein
MLRRTMPWVVFALLTWLAVTLGPLYVSTWWTGLGYQTRRGVNIGVLHGCLIAYGAGWIAALIGAPIAAYRVFRGRIRRVKATLAARFLLLAITILVCCGLLEFGAWGLSVRARRPAPIPPIPPPNVPQGASRSDDLTLLVLGESSAEGQPFEPWFSIGQVLAWQMEKAQPGRKVNVIMAARGGIPLTAVVNGLNEQARRPDLVLLYSGHNEFQARWGWSRTANYYPEDFAERRRDSLADWVGDITPFTSLIHAAVDRQRIDLPPVIKEDRDVVDRPVCNQESLAELHKTFSRELETIVTWCERAGAVPILVVPSGNEVGFDPDRSVLDASTRKADRARFGDEFLAVKQREAGDPEAAIAAYRELLKRQPKFAESHYRLARLLAARGQTLEAAVEFKAARDLDGLPMRCPSDFQSHYATVAAAHPSVLLVDGPSVLAKFSPTGLLDDNLFHDGHHPSFRAYLALAQASLDSMRDHRLFGLDKAVLPPVDPGECAAHFGLDTNAHWADIGRRAATFWERLASSRYDSSERNAKARRLRRAVEAMERGTRPDETGVPGFGVHPQGFP